MPSPITITGLIVDEANNVVTSGYVEFNLSPLNQALPYQVPGVCVVAKTVRGLIDATGHVKNIDGVSPLVIWPNDLLQPSNTLYSITIAPYNVVTRVYNNVLLQSSVNPQDLSSLTFILPQPVVGTVIEGSPLVTESVIPAVDLAYSLGDPTHRYVHVYAQFLDNLTNNLTVDFLHVTGWIDNPTGDLFLNDTVLIAGLLKLQSCVNFYAAYPLDFTQVCPQAGGPFNVQLPAGSGILALLNSPVFTGNPQAPTPAAADNSNSIATTAFVKTFIAPASPVTSVFGRIGAIVAQAGDYSVAQVTGAAPLASPALTGVPTAPTAAAGTSTTQLATTAFVQAAAAAVVPAPTRQTLGGNVALPANTLTSVISKVVTFPAGAGLYRADIRYGVWLTIGPNVAAAEVVDTTNNRHYALSGCNSNGSGFEGLAASEVSSSTYAAGAVVTFVLKVISNTNGTATVNSGIFSASITESSFLEITPVLSS